jgi:hypothetical protein
LNIYVGLTVGAVGHKGVRLQHAVNAQGTTGNAGVSVSVAGQYHYNPCYEEVNRPGQIRSLVLTLFTRNR